MIVQLKNIRPDLDAIKKSGYYFTLYNTGLTVLDSIYKAVKGYPLFIGGNVHHGKSELSLELCVSLSIQYGFKWAVYLGEAGKSSLSVIEIMQKVIGKNYFEMTDGDIIYAMQFIEKYFVILEIDDLTVKGFYEEVQKAEKELGIKFDGTLFDPFNDAKNGTGEYGGRTDIWLEEDLKHIRKVSHKCNRIDVVVFHVQEIKPIQDKETGKYYVRNAMPNEWAGGQVVNRRAMTQLLVYKLYPWMRDENGVEYGENKTMIINQKAKPKGTGKIGSCIVGWDWKRNRYFEEVGGVRKYMLDKHSQQIEPKQKSFEDIVGGNNKEFDIKDDTEPF